jgi:hypothetical protein
MSVSLGPVFEKVDLLLSELEELSARGPHFKIVHRFREHGTDCAPGEEIAWALLIYRSREYILALSLSLLLLFDYLAKNRYRPQSASQIISGMCADPFYARHGKNARADIKRTRKFGRSAVKEYVKRIRQSLHHAFSEAGLKLDPSAVFASEPTETNEVHYRLKATVEWVHFDTSSQ